MEDEKKKCCACKEPIWADATICPLCRTAQNKRFHTTVLLTLKEFSAITVIFSLIFAVVEFNKFTDSWFTNADYADQLAKAASLLIETGEDKGARMLLANAKKIYPASKDVGEILKQLAMKTIREETGRRFFFEGEDEKLRVYKEALNSLYSSIDKNNPENATLLAHIAWATYQIGWKNIGYINVKPYLDKALAQDPSNTYANAYTGYLLDEYIYHGSSEEEFKEQYTAEEIIKKKAAYFKTALINKTNVNYIKSLKLEAFSISENILSERFRAKLILEMISNNDEYYLKHKKNLLNSFKYTIKRAFTRYYREANSDNFDRNVLIGLEIDEMKQLVNILENNFDELWVSALMSVVLAEKQENNKVAIEKYIIAHTSFINAYDGSIQSDADRISDLLKLKCNSEIKLTTEAESLCHDFFVLPPVKDLTK